MTVLETIKNNRMLYRRSAMKTKDNRDVTLASLYTTILGEFERKDRDISDQGANAVLKSLLDKLNETKDAQPEGSDLSSLQIEIDEIKSLLPQVLSVDDLNRIKGASGSIGEYMKSVREVTHQENKFPDMKLAKEVWGK